MLDIDFSGTNKWEELTYKGENIPYFEGHSFVPHKVCLLSYVICRVGVVVFNATFNNISVISRQSVLLVDEIGVPGENH
jgi:hypothetical protein